MVGLTEDSNRDISSSCKEDSNLAQPPKSSGVRQGEPLDAGDEELNGPM